MSASVRVSPASLACVNSRQNKVPQHRLRAMASSSLVRPSIWAGLVSDHLISGSSNSPRLFFFQSGSAVCSAISSSSTSGRPWTRRLSAFGCFWHSRSQATGYRAACRRGSAMYLSSLQCGRQLSATSSGVRPKTPLSLPHRSTQSFGCRHDLVYWMEYPVVPL